MRTHQKSELWGFILNREGLDNNDYISHSKGVPPKKGNKLVRRQEKKSKLRDLDLANDLPSPS